MVSCVELFYLMLPVLHAVGALLSIGLSFWCDTGRAIQTARIPGIISGYSPGLREFMAAWPWDEGSEFYTHTWNPFALIFVFEWLTAGFALRPIKYYTNGDNALLVRVWLGWLIAGLAGFIVWSVTNTGGVCTAQFCTVVFSFVAAAWVCIYSLSLSKPLTADLPQPSSFTLDCYTDPHGRSWKVPRSLRHRRLQADEQGEEEPEQVTEAPPVVDFDEENLEGIAWRYGEYCITAPLLFLAVVTLLTAEGPAWLFLTGYWLLFTCNALGIALHLNFWVYEEEFNKFESPGPVYWLTRLFLAGTWSDPAVNLSSILQAAWVCLLVPMGGLVYLTRDVLFSSEMPILVLMMIWNLLVTYSMFGIVPTFVYITGLGRRRLAWMLDLLNVAAKFPLPIIILMGFITRPATTRYCY
jgi:hypothetical protein